MIKSNLAYEKAYQTKPEIEKPQLVSEVGFPLKDDPDVIIVKLGLILPPEFYDGIKK
tara:strand:+ start:90 stop:260 length:171 start_codon:yes stop_codon:yes gene_type:complete